MSEQKTAQLDFGSALAKVLPKLKIQGTAVVRRADGSIKGPDDEADTQNQTPTEVNTNGTDA